MNDLVFLLAGCFGCSWQLPKEPVILFSGPFLFSMHPEI
jgi:hypothetical protein